MKGVPHNWKMWKRGPSSRVRELQQKRKNKYQGLCLSFLSRDGFIFPCLLKWLTHVSYSVSLFCGLTRMLVANKLLSQQTNRRNFVCLSLLFFTVKVTTGSD